MSIPTLDRETCLYLAGLYDGEGCFTIATGFHKNGTARHSARISIAMVDKDAMEWLAEVLGRRASNHVLSAKVRLKSRPMYKVVIQDIESVISFIEQIGPYLRVKKVAAQTVLEFCRSRQGEGVIKRGPNPYTPREVALVASIRSINAIGLRKVG